MEYLRSPSYTDVKGKREVTFSLPEGPSTSGSGPSTSAAPVPQKKRGGSPAFLSNQTAETADSPGGNDFIKLQKDNSRLVYDHLVPELHRICMNLGMNNDKQKREEGLDFGFGGSFALGLSTRKILEDTETEEEDASEVEPSVESSAEAQGDIEEVGLDDDDDDDGAVELEEKPSGDSASKTRREESCSLEGAAEDETGQPARGAPSHSRKREDVKAAVEKVKRSIRTVLNARSRDLSVEQQNKAKPLMSVAESARVMGFPIRPPLEDVRETHSHLMLNSETLQTIRAISSMQQSKRLRAIRDLSPLRIRLNDVDEELLFNQKFRMQKNNASSHNFRTNRVPPAVGSQPRQWLPAYTNRNSYNKYADYHALISGGRHSTQERHSPNTWEGSEFKVALLEDLSTKLRLRVHFSVWKTAYECMISLKVLIRAATNKSNHARKGEILTELKKLLVQLRKKTIKAVEAIEKFIVKRSIRLWIQYCHRESGLREKFLKLSVLHQMKVRRSVISHWRKYCQTRLRLWKCYSIVWDGHQRMLKRNVLFHWLKYCEKELELERNFIQLAMIHDKKVMGSVMMCWKLMMLGRSIKDVNYGLASVFLRANTIHKVFYLWREAASKMRSYREALSSDINPGNRGREKGKGISYGQKSTFVKTVPPKENLKQLMSEMKKARSVLMPKVEKLESIQPTFWERTLLNRPGSSTQTSESFADEDPLPLSPTRQLRNLEFRPAVKEEENLIVDTAVPIEDKPSTGDRPFEFNTPSSMKEDEQDFKADFDPKTLLFSSAFPNHASTSVAATNQSAPEIINRGASMRTILPLKKGEQGFKAESEHETLFSSASLSHNPATAGATTQSAPQVSSQAASATLPTLVENSDPEIKMVSASTSPVQAPRMADAVNQVADLIESRDTGTVTDVADEDSESDVEMVSATTSPVPVPKMSDAMNQAAEEAVETQDIATGSDTLVERMVSATTSPVPAPRMTDAMNQAAEEAVESRDMATGTELFSEVMVSASTSPVQAPKMADAVNQVADLIESRDTGTATDVADEDSESDVEMISSTTSPVPVPKMSDAMNQAAEDVVETHDMATMTNALESDIEPEISAEEPKIDSEFERGSAGTVLVQDLPMPDSTNQDVNLENFSKGIQQESVGASTPTTTISVFMPSVDTAQYTKERRSPGPRMPPFQSIRSIKELAEDFYHRNILRRVIQAIKDHCLRSRQIYSLVDESYKWHVYSYCLPIWYRNTVVLLRAVSKRGDRVSKSVYFSKWERMVKESIELKEKMRLVQKMREVLLMKGGFALFEKAFSQSKLLKARLSEFRKRTDQRHLQKTMHIWRLWSNLQMAQKLAISKVTLRRRLRTQRQCLIHWWHLMQSNKMLRKVLTQASAAHSQESIQSTLGKTFSLLMGVLYAWKHIASAKGEGKKGPISKKIYDIFKSKQAVEREEQALRDTCQRMFLVWYLLAKNPATEDDRAARRKLRDKRGFGTEFKYFRRRLLLKYLNLLKKAIRFKRELASNHYSLLQYTKVTQAWKASVKKSREIELHAIKKHLSNLVENAFKTWRVNVWEYLRYANMIRYRLESTLPRWQYLTQESKASEHWRYKMLCSILKKWKASTIDLARGVDQERRSPETNESPEVIYPKGVVKGKRLVASNTITWKQEKGTQAKLQNSNPRVVSESDQASLLRIRKFDVEEFVRVRKSNAVVGSKLVPQHVVGQLEELRCQWKLEQLLLAHINPDTI